MVHNMDEWLGKGFKEHGLELAEMFVSFSVFHHEHYINDQKKMLVIALFFQPFSGKLFLEIFSQIKWQFYRETQFQMQLIVI